MVKILRVIFFFIIFLAPINKCSYFCYNIFKQNHKKTEVNKNQTESCFILKKIEFLIYETGVPQDGGVRAIIILFFCSIFFFFYYIFLNHLFLNRALNSSVILL